MANYYRITAYHPTEDISAIVDSYGMFDKLWQFSSYLIQKGFKVLEVSDADKFLDGNITKTEADTDKFFLRAWVKGKPESITYEQNNTVYKAVKVGDKFYVPDKTVTVGAL